MNTYWLSRNGGDPEGPFVESQIISMWRGGMFTAVDQLCEDGSQDWRLAAEVMGDAVAVTTAMVLRPERGLTPPNRLALGKWEPEEVTPERTNWFWVLVGVVALAVCVPVLIYAISYHHGRVLGLEHVETLKERVQKYVDANFADKGAEVMDVGGAEGWTGGDQYLVHVRYRSPRGGPVVSSYLVRTLSGSKDIVEMADTGR